MNKEQQVILTLLREIDEICGESGIECYLTPRLALHAVRGGHMPDNPFAGGVLMKVSDIEKFRLAVQKRKHSGRALESMHDNKRFPGFFLRYEDTNTLCFRMNEGRNYQYPGLGVDIYPLRGKIKSRLKHLWNRNLETGWKQFSDGRSEEYNWKERLCKIPVGLMFLGGRGRLGKHLYKKFCINQNESGEGEYVVRLKNATLYYPAQLFKKTKRVLLEGTEFTIPEDVDQYLRIWFGKKYENKINDVYVPSLTVMISTQTGCEDFISRHKAQIKELEKERDVQYRKYKKGRKSRESLDWSWEYVLLKGEGINLGQD